MLIWETSHRSFFRGLLRQLSASKTCLNAADNINRSVSHGEIQSGEVEDLILLTAANMGETMLGGKGKQTLQTMPSSNNTVSQCISDMAVDIETAPTLHTSQLNSMHYCWTNLQTLMGWLSSWLMSGTSTRGQLGKASYSANEWKLGLPGLWTAIEHHVDFHGWNVALCFPVMNRMIGKHSRLVTHVQAVAVPGGYTAAPTGRHLLPRECLIL